MMRRLFLLTLLGIVAPASAAPTFVGFAGGAFIQGPQSGSAVPNVIGAASYAAADATLTGAGFDAGAATNRCTYSVATEPLNEVIGQSPAPGVSAAPGSLVDLLISTGVQCKNAGRSGVRLKGFRMRGL